MKLSLASLSLASALAIPAFGSAANLQYNFLNNVPTGSTGVNLGTSSYSFKDTASDANPTITASVDPSFFGLFPYLYEKNAGLGETGLGITPGSDNEINFDGPGIKLDLSKLLAFHPSSISLNLNSVTGGDSGMITYIDGDHDGDTSSFIVNDMSSHQLDLNKLYEDGGSILVNAKCGNVLIGSVTATTPEPADAGILGLGLLGAGAFLRKRFGKKA